MQLFSKFIFYGAYESFIFFFTSIGFFLGGHQSQNIGWTPHSCLIAKVVTQIEEIMKIFHGNRRLKIS